ncbi:Isoflavone 2'-hydroxylase [Bertholletia excelsa]
MENLFYFFVLFLALLFIFKHSFHGNYKLPPSPLALPIIGHIHLIKNPPHEALQRLSSRYGPVLYLRFGSRSTVVVSSPSAVEECFTKNDVLFASRPKTMAGDCLTYDYSAFIWAPYGHLWRSLRRLAAIELFSSRSLQRSSVVRDEETRTLVSHMLRVRQVELKHWFSVLAFNIIMRLVAGDRCVKDEDAGKEVGREIVGRLEKTFLTAAPFNLCDYFPILRWIDYKGSKKSMMRTQKNRDEFLQELIDDFRRKRGESSDIGDDKEKSTLIGVLLRLQESEPEFYTEDIIKSIILVMFVGGIGTSVTTMERAMSLLLTNADALRKLRAEIEDHVGHFRLIADSDLPTLPYLHCVVSETLRLYPPAPLLLPHYSTDDCTIAGYEVPRGTTLLVNAWAMHRDPNVWAEPCDFRPERFQASTGEREEGFKFVPFGFGRRACPGSGMGVRAVSLAVGALVQCFDMKIVENEGKAASGGSGNLEILCVPRRDAAELLFQRRD